MVGDPVPPPMFLAFGFETVSCYAAQSELSATCSSVVGVMLSHQALSSINDHITSGLNLDLSSHKTRTRYATRLL